MIWRHFLFQLFNCKIIWLLELSQSCIVSAREKVGVERKNIATSFVRCAGNRTGAERKLRVGSSLKYPPINGTPLRITIRLPWQDSAVAGRLGLGFDCTYPCPAASILHQCPINA